MAIATSAHRKMRSRFIDVFRVYGSPELMTEMYNLLWGVFCQRQPHGTFRFTYSMPVSSDPHEHYADGTGGDAGSRGPCSAVDVHHSTGWSVLFKVTHCWFGGQGAIKRLEMSYCLSEGARVRRLS